MHRKMRFTGAGEIMEKLGYADGSIGKNPPLRATDNKRQLQYTVSSLEKVFPYKKPSLRQTSYTIFKNETFHFQVACYSENLCEHCRVELDSPLGEAVSARKVELVPAAYAVNIYKTDDYVLSKKPNGMMFPDLLRPLYPMGDGLRQNTWTAFWITVDGANGLPVGTHEIKIRVYSSVSGYDHTSVFTLTVLNEELPESGLYHTCWVHYDCICDKHGVEPFTPDFYAILHEYLTSAVKHGMTMLYTPLFTPAMDTGIGTYRRAVQLVKIKSEGDDYRFDFSPLDRFIDFALERGIKYFELSHLATQWGGKCCPQIMAETGGKETRIFGWDDQSNGEKYTRFLEAFLSAFAAYVKEKGIEEKIFFHISDEPPVEALERFQYLKNILLKYFPAARFMDAVCEKAFIDSGVVTHPVVGTDHYENMPCDWVYYCCVQTHSYLSNRLLNMPSQRTRIIGMQMYRNGSNGLLHWALNFYHSAGSHIKLDPYFVTDANGQFQSGDTFIVYPTENGVYESLRHEVLNDAFNDYRALKLLEKYVGKERVLALLDSEGVKAGYKTYNRSAKWHSAFRLKLNKLIMEHKNDKNGR